MFNDDLKMLEFAVNGDRFTWLMLVGLPLLGIVAWAARRAGEAKSRFSTIGYIGAAVVLCAPFLVGAVSFIIGSSKPFFGARAASRQATCQSNLRELARSVLLYTADFDDTFPPADRWADRVGERTTLSPAWFHCPSSESKFAYAFNRSLDGVPSDDLEEPTSLVMLFESDATDRNKSGLESDVMHRRHPAGSYVAFADGHVRRFHPTPDWPNYWDPKKFTDLSGAHPGD